MAIYKSEYDQEEEFMDYMNDMELVTILGYTYSLGEALLSVDPIAFRQEFLDWADGNDYTDVPGYSLVATGDSYTKEDLIQNISDSEMEEFHPSLTKEDVFNYWLETGDIVKD